MDNAQYQAISIGTDLEYSLIQAGQRLIRATELLESVAERLELNDFKILASCMGSALENIVANHPFYQRQIPVLLGDHVTTDAGTGCVHTAPDHV